jgi:hypothetical protein
LHATGIPVVDVANIEQQIQNEITNIVQYSRTAAQTLNSAKQLATQVQQLGSYANVNNLAGVSTIKGLVGTGESLVGQGQGIYGQLQGLTNPQQYTGQFQSLLNQYGSSSLNGLLSSGTSTAYTIPMQTAAAQAVENFQASLQQLNGQRQALQEQLVGSIESLQGATTEAEVQKINGEIAGLNGQLQTTDAQIEQAAAASNQVNQQSQAAATAATQAAAAQEAQDLEEGAASLSGQLPFSDTPIYWAK